MTRHHRSYLMCLALVALCQIKSIALAEILAERETVWPCPVEDEFAPCVCTTTAEFLLDADCSAAQNSDQLTKAFTARFSLLTFNSLTINHSGCATCDLAVLNQTTFGPISFVDVDIQHTNVMIVGESTFANSRDTLKSLILGHNQINSFTFQAIGEFPSLIELNFLSNKFDETTPIPDIESSTLERLIFSSNPGLTFTPSLVAGCPALKNLYLKNCQISSVPMNVLDVEGMLYGLDNIIHVDFSTNSITKLGTSSIQGVKNTLGLVDFSGNDIVDVSKNFVSGFGGNGKLDMSNNGITVLSEDVWSEIFTALSAFGEEKIMLSGNPLTCGCDMAWLFVPGDLTLRNVISKDSTCADTVTIVVDLPEVAFEQCPLKMGKIN